jgi:hypothetical protein
LDSSKTINIDVTTPEIITLPNIGTYSEVHIIKKIRTEKNYSIQYNNLQIAKIYGAYNQNITFKNINNEWII